ncbi:tripartite tricarboxylate transporter TctB family protein [Rossellomorea marisflavi]|uniref:tripartite tricarboxylate transporter TctB family protein n=1 Tax=Rossellomorea marisflavi TaxID=189381 RepID=UPI0034577671
MKRNMIIQIVLILCGVLFLVTAQNIGTLGFKGDVLDQRTYVVILSWLLIIFSAAGVVREYLSGRKGVTEKDKSEAEVKMDELEAESEVEVEKNSRLSVFIAMILLFLFVVGFSTIGYFVSSFIFVYLITWLMFKWDRKKWLAPLLFSVGLNGVLYVLFNVINVYFPKTVFF